MNYLVFALRNLAQRKIRTGLTVVSIAVAVAVLFTLLSFNKGYDRALRAQLQQMGVHAMVLPIGCPYEAASLVLKGGRIDSYLPESVMAEYIEKIEGIQIAAPAFMSGIVRPEEGRTDIYFGIDHRTFELKNWWKILKKPGTDIEDWEKLSRDPASVMTATEFRKVMEADDSLILGYDAALIELSTVGDEIYVPEVDRTFRIVGVLAPTGTQDDGFFYVPLRVTQQLFKQPGKITVVQLRFADPSTAVMLTEQLDGIPGAEVITMSELMGTMQSLMGSARTLIFSIVLVAIAISALGVLNTVLMSVFERTREIGVMRATGAGRGHVFALIWTETLALVLMGGAVGLLMAVVGASAIEGLLKSALAAVDVSVNVKGSLIAFEPAVFARVMVFVLGIGTAAGIYPAYRASRAKPIEALRAE